MNFNAIVESLPTYEAGKPLELLTREYAIPKENIIKLASNENPFGCSKLALEAIKNAPAWLYPDDSYYELKHDLAALYGLDSENFIIGSGSDQVIEFCLNAVCNAKRGILHAGVTFAMYDIYAKHIGAPIFTTNSMEHNLEEFLKIYEENKNEIGAIILCLPNNPLGECLDAHKVCEFISNIDENTLVMLDCAYMEFASYKDSKKHIEPAKLVSKFPNVVYLGTFSKAYGLGGMRVGYGISTLEIINNLHKLRPPFNIGTSSLAASIAALQDKEFIQMTIKNNLEQLRRYEEFAQEHNIQYIDSYTNFITFILSDKKSSCACFDNLLKKGIILRNLKSYGLNAIRITIGRREQNDKVLAELDKELS